MVIGSSVLGLAGTSCAFERERRFRLLTLREDSADSSTFGGSTVTGTGTATGRGAAIGCGAATGVGSSTGTVGVAAE